MPMSPWDVYREEKSQAAQGREDVALAKFHSVKEAVEAALLGHTKTLIAGGMRLDEDNQCPLKMLSLL